jgi:hypothetical protein
MANTNKKHKCNLCPMVCYKKSLCLHTYTDHAEDLKKRLLDQKKYRFPYCVDWGAVTNKLYFCLVCKNVWDNSNWAVRHSKNPGCSQAEQLEAINNFVKEPVQEKAHTENVMIPQQKVKNTILEVVQEEMVKHDGIEKCLFLLQQLTDELKLLAKTRTVIQPEIVPIVQPAPEINPTVVADTMATDNAQNEEQKEEEEEEETKSHMALPE